MAEKQLSFFYKKLIDGLSYKTIAFIMLGAMICSFGIHNIHQQTGITEGGVIGHFSRLYYSGAGYCLLSDCV